MATLSPKPEPVPPAAFAFFSARLGGCALDMAQEHCRMSIVLLQGGGLSRRQLDEVPLGRGQIAAVLRRWLPGFATGLIRRMSRDTCQATTQASKRSP